MPELFSRLLFTYGPFALLVFLAYVLEAKARNRIQQAQTGPTKADGLEKRIAVFTYLGLWVVMFLTCGVITYVWILLNVVPNEVTMKGRLTGLRGTEALATPFNDMYIRRVYSDSGTLAGVHWRIITPTKLPAGHEIDLFVDRSTSEHEDVGIFVLTISDDLYTPGKEIGLMYDRTARTLSLGNLRLRIRQPEAMKTTERRDDQPLSWVRWLSPVMPVFAAGPPDLEQIALGLEANDAVLRYKAREQLASLGNDAVPFIRRVLADPKSSYRLRLGVLVALNNLRGVGANPIAGDALCAIVKAQRDMDKELSQQATIYLRRHPSGSVRCG